MSATRNINDDATLAYLLQKNQKKSAENANAYTDKVVAEEITPAIEANATAIAKTCRDAYEVTLPNVSSSRRTFAVSGITAEHELIQEGFAYLSNPSAAGSDLVLVTADGSITVNGTMSGTTNIVATLCIKEQKVSGS